MSIARVNTDYLTGAADAIRRKTGSQEAIPLPQFESEIDNLPSGGTLISKTITQNGTYKAEDDNADGYDEVTVAVPREITKLVDGTITEYVDDEVTTIAPYAFYQHSLLERISISNAIEIGQYSFGYCETLTEISVPKVTAIQKTAFQFTPLIHPIGKPLVFPSVLSIGMECFGRYISNPPHDIGFYFPKLISIGDDAFRYRHATKVILKQQCALVRYSSPSFSTTVYYVPQRYFNWYTTATNWSSAYSAYPNSIQTIEDNIDYLVGLGYDRNELLKDEEVPT